MKNYLEYFIPKYQDPSGPLPSLVERNGSYYMVTDNNPMGTVVGEVPLSGTDPVGEFYVAGEVAGPLLKWFGKGLKWTGNLAWKGASKVAPKATGAVETAVKTAGNAVKAGKDKVVTGVLKVLKRNPNGKVVEHQISAEDRMWQDLLNLESEGDVVLPEGITPNYQGDHLALVKDRLMSGGAERIENPSLAKEVLANTEPIRGTGVEISDKILELGGNYQRSNLGPHAVHGLYYTDYAKDLSNLELLSRIFGKNSTYRQKVLRNLELSDADKVNRTVAHEFEHFAHAPKEPLSTEIVAPSSEYFSRSNNSEIAARFGQLKNYFGLKEGQNITPEMWEYAKRNYITDTGFNNNMFEFFDLDIKDLQKFLDWGNKHALSIAAPVGTGAVLYKANENN